MSTQSKVILGILGAAAAGVVIGLLIAPEKGEDMRKKLGRLQVIGQTISAIYGTGVKKLLKMVWKVQRKK